MTENHPPIYRVRPFAPGPDGWAAAERLTDFAFPWLECEAPRTSFRALWDDSWLSFRFDIIDPDLVLAGGDSDDDKVLGSDRAEYFFTTGPALDPYYCLEMDPRGLVYAYRARFYREFDPSWTWPGLEVEAVQEASGYTVAGRLPLASFDELGLLDRESMTLQAGLYRAEFSHGDDGEVIQNWISWIDPRTGKPDFHVPASFGTFKLETADDPPRKPKS